MSGDTDPQQQEGELGVADCPARNCDGRSSHDPPYRPDERYYDYVDPGSGHAIRIDKAKKKDPIDGTLVDTTVKRCMTRLYRKPADENESKPDPDNN